MQLTTLWLLWFLQAVWRVEFWKGFENWAYQPWPANCQWRRMNYSAIILKVKEVPRKYSNKKMDWLGIKAWLVTAMTIKMLSLSSKEGQDRSFLGGNGTLGQFYCSQLWQASQPEQPWFHLVTHCHTGISCSLLMVPPFTQKHTEPPAFAMRFHLQSPSSAEPHSACLHWKDYDSNFLQSYSAQQMEGDSCLWQGS